MVSLSGINAWTLDRSADLSDQLASRGVPLSVLFAPRISGADQPGAVLKWVRERHAAGDALLQHGYDHAAEPRERGITIRRRAEFASLPAHEAGLRLTAAGTTMERLGLRTHAFVPPRWVASPGTHVALRNHGFHLCADLMGVHDLHTRTVHRGRVQGFGFGERTEPWWCFALVMGASRIARRGGLIRLAVDTADLARSGPRQALLDAVDIALHHGARGCTYPDLVTRRPARAA